MRFPKFWYRAFIIIFLTTLTTHFNFFSSPKPSHAQTPGITESVLPIPNLITSYSYGKLAEDGGITAIFYGTNNSSRISVYFRDGAGNFTTFLMPAELRQDEAGGLVDAILDGNTLWILSGKGPLVIRQYQLSGSPLPTQAALISATSVGDLNSHTLGNAFIHLKSGGLIAMWYEDYNPTLPDTHIDYGFGYRSPAGTWSTIFPVSVSGEGLGGTITMSKQAIAQHPVDDSIWAFSKRDSYHSMEAFHLTEITDGVRLDWINRQFLNSNPEYDGIYGPDGEFPDLVAVADKNRNTILLAYQNWNRQIFSTDPWIVGAYVSILQVGTDGAKSFIIYPAWVERVRGLALIVRPDALYLAYTKINETLMTSEEVWMNSYNFNSSTWGVPIFLTNGRPNVGPYGGFEDIMDELASASNNPQIVMLKKDATNTYSIHVFDIALSTSPLSITKQVDRTSAKSGDTLTYTIQYTVGNQNATNAIISDNIPNGTTFVSVANSGVFDGTKVTWNLGNLTSSATGSVTFQVKVL